MSGERPVVTALVAAYDSAATLPRTIASIARQTLADIEILVVDDGSRDDTAAVAARLAEADPRIRLIRLPRNLGPAGARNAGLDAARGDWIAIVDADDVVDADRLERALAAARARGAQIVCDDVRITHADGSLPPATVLPGRLSREHGSIDLHAYIVGNARTRGPSLGYLQPIVRRALVERHGLRFDESLRIGEDFDFMLRLFATGETMLTCPWATYHYEKRAGSISHRLSRATVAGMIAADERFRAHPAAQEPRIRRALDERRAGLERTLDFVALLDALKARDLAAAAAVARRRPSVLLALSGPVRDRAMRSLRRLRRDAPAPEAAVQKAK